MKIKKEEIKMVCIDDFALKKRHRYGTVMIDIETHQIIDLLESRDEKDVTEWLETYPNIEVISRDGGIVYKSSSDKAHPKAKQISDRFHVLKNLTDYASNAIKRLLNKQIIVNDEETTREKSNPKKKYEYKTKWDIIIKVKELIEQKYRIVDIAEYLGISIKTVIEYNKIPLEDKEKYNQISTNTLKSETTQKNKWELIKKVQEEYIKCHKYSVVARKFDLDDRTVKNYINIKEPPVNGNKNREYGSKLNPYKNTIIKMNNEGCSWKVIMEAIKKDGFIGSGSLLRKYLSKIKKEKIKVAEIKHIVERSTMISLLYKEIDEVKNISKELFDKVIKICPQTGKIYELIKDFKDIMFSKHEEKLDEWISKTKELNIQEINSFISRNRKRYRCC